VHFSVKRFLIILCFVELLNACASQNPQSSQVVESVANSAKPTASLPKPASKSNNAADRTANSVKPTVSLTELLSDEKQPYFYRFNYHIQNLVEDANTIKFQTRNSDFVFNRKNGSWTVHPGSIPSNFVSQEKKHSAALSRSTNPPYETIKFKGKTYQYRVNLKGTSEPPDCQKEAKAVIELITPGSKQPRTQTLYTGGCLSFPYITTAKIYGNRLWWSLAFPQGEGFSGKTTLVGYDPQQDKWMVIHPQGMGNQEIVDFEFAGDPNRPTIWMATKLSGECVNYVEGMGLVAYRPDSSDFQSGSVTSYRVDNSPLIGAIPDKLLLESDKLWVGTGNGVCQLQLSAPNNPESWKCWRFALMAELPTKGLPLYSALLNQTPAVTLNSSTTGQTVEVLWWLPTDQRMSDKPIRRKGRYEVRYDKGFTVTLNGQGATLWSEFYGSSTKPPVWFPPVNWCGWGWHWNGDRFVRGFDDAPVEGGCGIPRAIGPEGSVTGSPNALRGDLELLNLSRNSTTVKYYSGWVDDALLKPYLSVVPQERPKNFKPNPLESVANQLPSQSPNISR